MPSKAKGTVLAVVGLAALAVVATWLVTSGGPEDVPRQKRQAVDIDKERRADAIERRGQPPQWQRIKNGNARVLSEKKALAEAEAALAKVLDELRQAEGDKERARLERKKQLVEQAIDRLTGAPDTPRK